MLKSISQDNAAGNPPKHVVAADDELRPGCLANMVEVFGDSGAAEHIIAAFQDVHLSEFNQLGTQTFRDLDILTLRQCSADERRTNEPRSTRN